MNATFAYFTATAAKKEATSTTGVVSIKFSNTKELVNSVETTSSTLLLPGDTLSLTGTVENAGSAQVYVLLEFIVSVKKSDSTTEETVLHEYYTFVSSTLTEITGTMGNYSINAGTIDATTNNTKSFSLSHKFDGATYDDTYQKAEVTYILYGYAVQSANISAADATDLLFEKTTSNT